MHITWPGIGQKWCIAWKSSYIKLKLATKEERNLVEFASFACLIYARAWILSPSVCDAPINYLVTFQQIKQYLNLNKSVSESLMKISLVVSWIWAYTISIVFGQTRNACQYEAMWRKLERDRNQTTNQHWGTQKEVVTFSLQLPLVHDHSTHVDLEFSFKNDSATWDKSVELIEVKTIVNNLEVVNDAAVLLPCCLQRRSQKMCTWCEEVHSTKIKSSLTFQLKKLSSLLCYTKYSAVVVSITFLAKKISNKIR